MSDPSTTPASNRPISATSPKAPSRRMGAWLVVALLVLGTLSLAVYAFVPRDIDTSDAQGKLAEVSILHERLANARPLILLAGFVELLVAGIILLARRWMITGVLLVLGAFIATFFALGAGLRLGPWTICDEITLDGTTYYFIDSSFLQGQTMAIARLKTVGRLYRTLEVLGCTNGDSPRSYLRVVRPAPINPVPYGALYATPDGRQIVGLRYDNACYLVYDMSTRQFYGHSDVEKLSPFLLLGENSQLHAPDEAAILKSFGNGREMGQPTREVLNKAISHANPAVRQSASAMLQAQP